MTEPMVLRAHVAAPVKEVRHALTDPAALRVWFAEHAEVDLPHRYEFWGRYTPEGTAPHQRLLQADEHTLRFTWLLDGEDTTTEIQLDEGADGSTLVSLSQTHFDFNDVITGASIRGVLQTFWALAIANLVDYVEGREPTPRCDFTSTQLRGDILIDAPTEAVYDSLTDSAKATQWFGFPIDIEPHTGGRFAMGGIENNPQPAIIVDLQPGRAMSIDWGPSGITTWDLADSDGKTRLTFVQSGFDEQHPPYGAWSGWLAGLAALRRFHEQESWRPIWLPPSP